jgi:hypothetical protein
VIRVSPEEVVELVRAFEVGRPDSLVVVIPKAIRDRMCIEKGTRFYMKVDRRGRLIYERMRALSVVGETTATTEKERSSK